MEKLKKLFPLSFKFNGNVGKLILSILFYLLIEIAAGLVVSIVFGIISTLVTLPLMIFAIPYVGWVLAIILLPIVLILVALVILVSVAESIANKMVSIYVIAGIVVSFIAYARSDDKKPDSVDAVDAALEAEDTAVDENGASCAEAETEAETEAEEPSIEDVVAEEATEE